MKNNEVFAEKIVPGLHFDTSLYFSTGAEGYRERVLRNLYRLRYDAKCSGVKYELLATFHARIVAREVGSTGRQIAVVAGRNCNGSPFLFRCPLDYLTSGRPGDAKRFHRAFHNAAGTCPSYVVPGKLAATIRAILAFTAEGEPIPNSADELAVLDE